MPGSAPSPPQCSQVSASSISTSRVGPGRRLGQRRSPPGRRGRAPRCCRLRAAAAEEIVAEEGGEEVGDVGEVAGARVEAAAPQPGVAVAVVELAGLLLGEHLVGLDDELEALLRLRMVGDVRVELAREGAERLLDLGRRSRCAEIAEELVVVAFGRRHRVKGIRGGRGRRRLSSRTRWSHVWT